jgi:hypothetical protein
MSVPFDTNKNRVFEEPRSHIIDAEPRNTNPNRQVDVTRKGIEKMDSREVDRIIREESGAEPKASKGSMKLDGEAHVPDEVGFEAGDDSA